MSDTKENKALSDYYELKDAIVCLEEIKTAIENYGGQVKQLVDANTAQSRSEKLSIREYSQEQIDLLKCRYLDVENIAEHHNEDTYIEDKEAFNAAIKEAIKGVNEELQASHIQLGNFPDEIKQRATDIDVIRKHKDEVSEKLAAFSQYAQLIQQSEKAYDTLKKSNSSKNYDNYNLKVAQKEGFEHTNIHVQRVIDSKEYESVKPFTAIKKEAQELNSVMRSLNKQEKALLNLDTKQPHLDLLNKSSEVRSQAASNEADSQFKRLKAGVMMMTAACAVAGKTVYDTLRKAAELAVKTTAAAVVVGTVLVGKSYYFGDTGDLIQEMNNDIAAIENYNPNTDSVNLYNVMSDTFFGTTSMLDKVEEIKARSDSESIITVQELMPIAESIDYNAMNIDASILNNVNSLQSDDEITIQNDILKMADDEKTFSI